MVEADQSGEHQPLRAGLLDLRQRPSGVVHVVQTMGAVCGARGYEYMTVLERNLSPSEIRRRAESADWCKNCLGWVARW